MLNMNDEKGAQQCTVPSPPVQSLQAVQRQGNLTVFV
jgi:hypothetical protein